MGGSFHAVSPPTLQSSLAGPKVGVVPFHEWHLSLALLLTVSPDGGPPLCLPPPGEALGSVHFYDRRYLRWHSFLFFTGLPSRILPLRPNRSILPPVTVRHLALVSLTQREFSGFEMLRYVF